MAENKMSFEKSISRLDEVVRTLERGDAPLEESLKLFEEGMSLVRISGKLLDSAERKIVKLLETADGTPLELEFDGDEH